MSKCPNKNLPEYKALVQALGELNTYKVYISNNYEVPQMDEVQGYIDSFKGLNYSLKSISILQSPKADEIFRKGDKNNWNIEKILQELRVPKEQQELIKSFNTRNREEILTSLLANYSYTVEINTAKAFTSKDEGYLNTGEFIYQDNNYKIQGDEDYGYEYFKNNEEITAEQFREALNESGIAVMDRPTQHYSNLTVPGGTNYTENEIAIPGQLIKEKPQGVPIKQGVKELFESNPELANQVYEALGFETELPSVDNIIETENKQDKKEKLNKRRELVLKEINAIEELISTNPDEITIYETKDYEYDFNASHYFDKSNWELSNSKYKTSRVITKPSYLHSHLDEELQKRVKNLQIINSSLFDDVEKINYSNVFKEGKSYSSLEVLKYISNNKKDVLSEIAKTLIKYAEKNNVEIQILKREPKTPAGRYKVYQNKIEIFGKENTTSHTLIHEIIHSFSSRYIYENPKSSPVLQLENILKNILDKKILKEYSNFEGSYEDYATKNTRELLAEIISRPDILSHLALYDTNYNLITGAYKKETLLDKIIKTLSDIFNFSKNEIETLSDLILFNARDIFEASPLWSEFNRNQITPQQKQQAQELYSQYLDTIFPDSKVKDIVYHGSPENFEQFDKNKLGSYTGAASAKEGVFFGGSIEVSKAYLDKRGQTLNLNELIKNKYGEDVSDKISKGYNYIASGLAEKVLGYKPERIVPIGEYDDVYGIKLRDGSILFDTGDYKGNDVNAKFLQAFIKRQSELKSSYDDNYGGYIDKNRNITDKPFEYLFIRPFILSVSNPSITSDKGKNYREDSYVERIKKAKGENKDGVIIQDTYDSKFQTKPENVYVVFDPEQIHILGSKQDIEGFKKWVKDNTKTVRKGAITPSIKGHAQFSTDNGIGWFRSDEQRVSAKDKQAEIDGEIELQKAIDEGGAEPGMRLLSLDKGEGSKTRRILEVQSDLFQKGRDKEFLVDNYKHTPGDRNFNVTYEGKEYKVGTMGGMQRVVIYKTLEGQVHYENPKQDWLTQEEIPQGLKDIVSNKFNSLKQEVLTQNKSNKENQFLQLLNKDNNWVTFFIKSIIQDSAKKGYEKVLFPSGNTASKVEGHTTLEEFKKQKEDRIKELESRKKQFAYSVIEASSVFTSKISSNLQESYNEQLKNKAKEVEGKYIVVDKSIDSSGRNFGVNLPQDLQGVRIYQSKEVAEKVAQSNGTYEDNEINQLKQELERVEREGFGALKPIYKFYEETVTNILKKLGTVNKVTDEYGNTWNEVEVKEKHKETILLSTGNIRAQLDSLVSTLALEDVQKELSNLDNIDNYIQANENLSNFLKKAQVSNSTLTISFGTELDNEFNSGTNHININLLETKALSELSGYSFKDTLDIMIKHELAHSSTYYAVHEDKKIEKSLQELLDVFKEVDKKNPFIDRLRPNSRIAGETYQYNLDEFIADIYSNPEFIKYTQSITPEGSKITLLDKVLNWIKTNILNKFFGYKSQIKDSLYSEVIKKIETQEVSDLNELASTYRGEDGLSLKANPSTAKSLKDKLHDSLIIQQRIYQSSNSKALKADIESLQNALKNNTELESFLILINDASKYLGQMKDRIDNITKLVPDYSFKNTSQETRNDIVHQLNEIMSFMSAYNILGELQDLSEEPGYEGLNTEALKNALDYRRRILKEYKNLIYPLMADFLYNSDLDSTLQKKQGSEFQNLGTRDSIEEQLRVGITDIGVFERLLGATISSSDPLGGLIASKLKEELERARTKDLEVSNNLLYLYDKLSGPKAIPAELNSKYISKILNYEKTPLIKDGKQVLDENGDPVFEYKAVQRLGIHTPYRTDLLAKSKKELYDRIGQRPPEDSQAFTAWAKEVAKWYSENTIVRNSDELIQQKKDTLTNFEFLKWFKDNTKELDDYYSELEHEFRYNSMLREYPDRVVTKEDITRHSLPKTYLPSEGNKFYIFTGEFTQPNEKYRNKEFDKLKEDSYFLALYNTYTDANTKLGTRGLKHGMLPQVYKEGLDKVYDTGLDAKGQFNNFKEYLSNNWGVRGTDAALGIITLDGTETKNIPVYYTQTIPERELSLDLLSSVLRFSQMSNSYEALNKNKAYVETLTDMIKGGKGLSARVVKSEKTNTLKGLINKTIPIATSNTNDQILKFIDQVMYGQSEVQSIATILGEQISLNKVADRMIAYSSVLTLSMNFIGMFNNTIWGNYSTFNEAAVGKYATKIEWLKAQGIYNKELVKGSFIRDVSVITDKSLYTQIAQYFDAFQGEYSSEYGHKISGTKAGRLFSSDILFFTTNAAEHQIQMQGMIMLMLNQKTKLNGKEVNLTEIFEKDNRGILRVKKGAQFSEKDKMAFINKLHAINKSLHGNYNKFDKSLMQRHWWGKLLLQFRKYMYTSYKRRYQKEQIDVELGDTVQGYYNTFFGSLYQAIKQKDYAFLTDFKDKATAEERAAWIKTRADLVFLAGLLIFSSLIGGLGDDDDEYNKTTLNHLSLQSRRLIGDITMLTPIGVLDGDLLRIMRNPVVSTSSTGLLIDAFGQTGKDVFNLVQGKDLEVYKTNTKYHDSGDSKLKYKWQRTIPWFNNYNKLVNPETQLNVFNRPAWQ